ncbi:MAG: methylenetetrahydrofolate--tRNA-(uracil(54)-C(5))-methyltransferase (FADH(2)-oxidizing) TrmFO [Bacilli bacterium]
MEKNIINVIGAGLAGCECALYLAKKGYKVNLYEQKPLIKSPAHHSEDFAELVCSNSLKSKNLDNACGLLKEEMRLFDSIMMEASSFSSVPSGNALSVDRNLFSSYITKKVKEQENIQIHYEEVKELKEGINIIATGPLTSPSLTQTLQKMLGEEFLFFFDAAAPIVTKESIDMNIAYKKSRYEQGDDSYINCPFTKEEYEIFYNELVGGEIAKLHEFDKVFEGCMPIEVMAKRGEKTLRFGPLKPKGLEKDGVTPYAVLQLRQDNEEATLYNLVGFQTNLTFKEQKRIFRLIPGLANAEFIRYGLMHRNTFICTPKYLNKDFSLKGQDNVYVVGQLCGVEGYVESAMSGLLCAIYLDLKLQGKEFNRVPDCSMMGSLINYICNAKIKNFAPMNANFGIMFNILKDKMAVAERSLAALKEWKKENL